MKNLKQIVIMASFVRLFGQSTLFLLRFGSLVVFARLLEPQDFGIVAMVTAITGLYELLIWGGLSAATIQKEDISTEQMSTLFWTSILIGVLICLSSFAIGPLISALYGEPRLWLITVVLGCTYAISATNVQHSALLHRHLKYGALAIIDIASLVFGLGVGIAIAIHGGGYWALVATSIASHLFGTVCLWAYTGWMPHPPHWEPGSRSLLEYGGAVTANSLVLYLASNTDKVLLGRYWGPELLGLYGRAYQLISFGTSNLQAALGPIAFSALSRVQKEPVRHKNLFLQFYALVNSVTVPATIFCLLFSEDLIAVVLGQNWHEAAPIFRFLAPIILVVGMTNPLSWLLLSAGLHRRNLAITLTISSLVIMAFVVGVPYGATGVALAYSVVAMLWLVPQMIWSVRGTTVSLTDLLSALQGPILWSIVSGGFAMVVQLIFQSENHPFLRILLGCGAMGIAYALLFFWMGPRSIYVEVYEALKTNREDR